MLAASSRRFTSVVRLAKSTYSAPKSRKYASEKFPSLKLATYEGAELAQVQGWLDKVNADPTKRKALNNMIDIARTTWATRSLFWEIYAPAYGVAVPASGVKREVLVGVVRSTTESWSEYEYALRSYQSKLQQDASFYALHADLASKDQAKAKKARSQIVSFIKSIPTKSEMAKKGVLHLIRKGLWDAVRNGEASEAATDYIKQFKREVKIELTTPNKLSAQELEHYQNRFNQVANDERTKVIMTTKEDPSLLGGFVVNINGTVYDESWKTQQQKAMAAIAKFNNL